MTTRWRKLGIRATAGLAVAAAPVAAACSSGPSYEDWAATDGAAGRINLDDVQTAFKESESVTEFEKRVNEIFEGDGVVLIKAEQTDTAFVLEGWENLDGNVRIDEGTDEKLFTITEKEDKSHEMRGHHANGYYHSTWGAGSFLFSYLLLSSFVGPRYVYVTPASRVAPIRTDRSNYRNSSAYRSQVSKNGSYFNRQKGFAGSSYDSADRNRSAARQSYQSHARSAGTFRSSGTGVRSSWGTSGRSGFSSGRSGGFFGGGGGQTFLGSMRRPG
ncbi:MAG: hypothetical protein F4W93_09855 [Dehalococcoidia bacterium]|nr:hypothetical protein [Dehalococcoidia bacterium]